MNRVQVVLSMAITALKASERDTYKDTVALDEIIRNLLDNFDETNATEAAFVVSVAVLCLRVGRSGNGGFKPLMCCHAKMNHFKEFHQKYGNRIINWGDECDDEITKAVQYALEYGYHSILTGHWMDETLIKLQIAA